MTLEDRVKDLDEFKKRMLSVDWIMKLVISSKIDFLLELAQMGALNPEFKMPDIANDNLATSTTNHT